jgi:flagellar biosynthesis protein FliQ
MEPLIEHLQKGILLSILLSAPSITAAASIGLLIGILQAVTSVQEQTISAAPKILLVFLVVLLTGSLMLEMTGGYLRESATLAFGNIAKGGEARVLPPR